MNNIYKKIVLIFLLLSSFNLLYGQVGVYDEGFGTGGKIFQLFNDGDVIPKAVVTQTDGKIIVAGSGGDFFQGLIKIVRYNVNGSMDPTFGSNGIAAIDVPSDQDPLQTLTIQQDGKIIAGGIIHTLDQATQQTDEDFYLFRLKTDGSYDSSFGTNGLVVTDLASHSDDVIHKLLVKPDGKILAGGYYMDMNNGDNYYGLVQYKTDGSRDSTFGINGITVVLLPQQEDGKGSLALLPNGKILVATTVVNDTSFFYQFGLLRFTANGVLDANFGNGGILHLGLSYFHSVLHDMAVQTDGKIVMTGETQGSNATVVAVVRVDSAGAYDLNFGDSGVVRTHISTGNFDPDAGMALTIQPDKKIIVGCTLYNSINSPDANFAVIRYMPDGTVDSNYGRQGIIITDFDENGDFAKACLQQADGKFILVGSAESQNFETGFGIARYLSDARFYYNTLKGSVFYDDNNNAIKDPGEDFFGNAVVAAQKTGIDTITITASNGIFNVEVDTGNYIIRPIQPATHPPYYTAVPNFRTISHSNYFNTDSVSFAMQPIPGMRDIFVYIIPLDPARPGFNTDYMIVYGNNGTDTVPAGTVQFVPSNFVTVNSTDPIASSTSGDTLRWDYVNLGPHDTSFIIVHATIMAPPAVNIGDTLTSSASISPLGLDNEPKDNNFILNEDVVGSFDPNDKNENHAGKISTDQVNAGEYMQYIIRFQNMGTDTAFNIYVRDTLQNKLDWSTMEMVAASHPYHLVKNDGICVWSFNNIALVDATHNEPASHGYIVYRIRAKTSVVPGDIINNKASIYFDYNLPVATNTETTVVTSVTVPVSLLNFSVKKTGKTHLLIWNTTNEINANKFEVERSATGTFFKKIGTVASQPGNAGIKSYDYTDALPFTGFNYYRLKIIDNDGRFEYSPVRILNNKAGNHFVIYPNPVKDVMRVSVEVEEKVAIQVKVFALNGTTILTDNWNVEEGNTIKAINVAALPRGTYLLKIISMNHSPIDNDIESTILKFEKQ